MTLLESIVAFIVLALVGIACLDLSRGAVDLQRSSEEWTRAVTIGESALAAAAADLNVDDTFANGVEDQSRRGAERAMSPRVIRRAWRDGVDVIEVSVALPGGGDYRVSRLVVRTSASARVAAARSPEAVR